MPLLIAHRGLLNGPNKNEENAPDIIEKIRSLGYDAEIDLWYQNDKWFLGHDEPQYAINLDWLRGVDQKNVYDQHHIWIHAKDIATLFQLKKIRWEGHIFFHQNDDCVLTSSGYIWTYPGKELTTLSVSVMPEWTDSILRCKELDVYAFCSDYIIELQDRLQ